jgi:hypothetical protein
MPTGLLVFATLAALVLSGAQYVLSSNTADFNALASQQTVGWGFDATADADIGTHGMEVLGVM